VEARGVTLSFFAMSAPLDPDGSLFLFGGDDSPLSYCTGLTISLPTGSWITSLQPPSSWIARDSFPVEDRMASPPQFFRSLLSLSPPVKSIRIAFHRWLSRMSPTSSVPPSPELVSFLFFFFCEVEVHASRTFPV